MTAPLDIPEALSPQNPWPGLRAFAETDSDFFFGREVEIVQLQALVQRARVVVLYGQSGLGKTSLLQAGLFPALRKLDFLPLRIRLNYERNAPPLAGQIKTALAAELDRAQVTGPRPGPTETLWEFFHRRNTDFWGARNRLLTPVIVLDQFEEIFTLGQRDEAALAAVAWFTSEIEALLEHHPSDSVRQMLEADPEKALLYDIHRESVKFIFSLREDFMAGLDRWRAQANINSINRNHFFPLERMTGSQALEVLQCAGRDLVEPDVARAIVDFVSASRRKRSSQGIELRSIEPAILSLVCSELNSRRCQQHEARVTTALLTGQSQDIIEQFYERGFQGLDPRMRDWVEDELLTAGGYRQRAALDDALRLGLKEEDFDRLVGCRLLHREERDNIIWLELTHDVLTDPASKSRAVREQRRQAEAAKAREAETKKSLQKAMWLMAAFGVLALLAIVASFVAWRETKTAETEKAKAEASSTKAEASSSMAIRALFMETNALNEAEREKREAETNAFKAVAAENQQRRMHYDVLKSGYKNARLAGKQEEATLWIQAAADLAREMGINIMDDDLTLQCELARTSVRVWAGAPSFTFEEMWQTDLTAPILARSATGKLFIGRPGESNNWSFEPVLQDLGNCDELQQFGRDFVLVSDHKLRRLTPLAKPPWFAAMPLLPDVDPIVESAICVTENPRTLWFIEDAKLQQFDSKTGSVKTAATLDAGGAAQFFHLAAIPGLKRAAVRATVSGQRNVMIFDMDTGQRLLKVECRATAVPLAQVGSRVLYAGDDGTDGELIGIDLADPANYWHRVIPWLPRQILQADTNGFLVADSSGHLRRWSPMGDLLESKNEPGAPGEFHVFPLPSGEWVDSGGQLSLRRLDADSKPLAASSSISVQTLALWNDDLFLAADDGFVEARSLADDHMLRKAPIHAQEIECDAGHNKFYARDGSTITCYDFETFKAEGQIQDVLAEPFLVLSNNLGLVVELNDGLFHYDTRLEQRERIASSLPYAIFHDGEGAILIVETNPDSDGLSVYRYNFETFSRESVASLPFEAGNLTCVQYDPANNRVLSGHENGMILAHPLDAFAEASTSEAPSVDKKMQGREKVVSISVLANGGIVAARYDGTLDRFVERGEPTFGEPVESVSPFNGNAISQVIETTSNRLLLSSAHGDHLLLSPGTVNSSWSTPDASVWSKTSCRCESFYAYPSGMSIILKYSGTNETSLSSAKVSSAAFSKVVINPCETLLAACDQAGAIHFWPLDADHKPGVELQSLPVFAAYPVFNFISDDTMLLANLNEACSVRVSTNGIPAVLWSKSLSSYGEFACNVAAFGDNLLVFGDDNRSRILVTSAEADATVKEIALPEPARALALGGTNSDTLLVGGEGKVFVFRTSDWKDLHEMKLPIQMSTYYARSLCFLNDEMIAIGGKNHLWLARLTADMPFMDYDTPDYVWNLNYLRANKGLFWGANAAYGVLEVPDFSGPVPSRQTLQTMLARTLTEQSAILPWQALPVVSTGETK